MGVLMLLGVGGAAGEADQAVPLVLTAFRGADWVEGPDGTWTCPDTFAPAATAGGKVLLGDGRLIASYMSSADSDRLWICLNTSATATDYYQCPYSVAVFNAEYRANAAPFTATFTGVAPAINDLFCLSRVGSTITVERSADSGASWTVLHTFPTTSSAALYAVFNRDNPGVERKVMPTGVGFTDV